MSERKENSTPKWKICEWESSITVRDENGKMVCRCTKNELGGKYARMIVTFPKMYAELKDLLDAMEAGLFPQAAPGVDYPAVMEKKWELRKLLKKARGEE